MRLSTFIAALAFCIAAISVGRAESAVYWASGPTVGASNLDGSSPQLAYLEPAVSSGPADAHGGVAVSESHLYWHGIFGISRVNFEGPAVIEPLVAPDPISSGPYASGGLALSSSDLFWGNFQGNAIGRAKLDGSETDRTLVEGLDGPCGVAVGPTRLYWADRGGIGRANLDGSDVERGFIPTASRPCGVAVDGQHVYWGVQGSLGRANLDGSEPDEAFIAGIGSVSSVATNSSHVFWTERPEGMAYASVGRAELDGTDVNRGWVMSQSYELSGVAVDARPSPPPILLLSRPFQLGQVRRNLGKGTMVVDVFVPRRGELRVVAPAVGWKVLKGPEPPPALQGSFRWRLKLWPGKRGRLARRIHSQLRRRGRAPIALRLSYTETGPKLPRAVVKRLAFRKKKPRPARSSYSRSLNPRNR